jgi:outer membrane lipoprotein SlyB
MASALVGGWVGEWVGEGKGRVLDHITISAVVAAFIRQPKLQFYNVKHEE